MNEEAQSIGEVIEFTEKRFVAIAPKAMKYAAEKGFAIQLLKNNGYLMKAAKGHTESLQQAITNVAAIGLSLNPAEKLAYLIPRNVKDGDNWATKIFLEPSYMGLCRLATNTGSILWVQANMVCEGETLVDNGPGERLTHIYDALSKDRTFDNATGFYAVAKTKDGDYLNCIMTIDDVISIRDRSESWKRGSEGRRGPWESDPVEMGKKTAVRRGFKMWPRTNENERLAEAIHLSEQNEGFDPILTAPEIKEFTADQKAYFDQLIETANATEMAAFRSSLEEQVFTNLYHSFVKGTKGKYQAIVDDLAVNGLNQLREISDKLNDLAAANDDLGIAEIIGELSDNEMNVVNSFLTDDAIGIIQSLNEETA